MATASEVKRLCAVCRYAVHKGQKSLYCDVCNYWLHLQCSELDETEYLRLSALREPWYCKVCLEGMFPFNCIDNNVQYKCCLYNLSHFDKPSTETIKNAEQLKVVNELFAINRDIDPDYNYLQAKQLMSVNYILPNEFKDCIKNPSITSNNFSILHFNARSLVNKIDNVINFLDELAFEFAILAVTETWANSDNDSRLNIPGYKLYNKNRPSKRGGGVAAYIKESLCFVARNDLDQYYSDEFEFLCVKVLQGKFHNNIVVIYRPPNANIAVFTDTYNKLMTKLSKEKCVTYVAGDFNINLLNYETHNDTNCF